MKPINTEAGLWNGIHADITACMVEINRNEERPMHWYNAFVNTHRQAIEVTYKEPGSDEVQTFLIDNANGTGYYKVTRGKGSPGCPHAGVGEATIVRYLPADEWARVVDIENIKFESEVVKDCQMATDPVEYDKLQAQQKAATEFANMSIADRMEAIRKMSRPGTVPATQGTKDTPKKRKRPKKP